MGILEGLSQGFRAAGATLSPEVYNTQRQEDASKANQQNLVLGALIKAVESGAASPDILQKYIAKAGIQGAPAIGPSLDAQKQKLSIDKDAREQQQLVDFQNWQAQRKPLGDPQQEQLAIATEAARRGLTSEATKYTALGNAYKEGKDKVSPLGQLIAERDALPADSPNIQPYNDAITKNSTQAEKDTMNERAMARLRAAQIKVNRKETLTEDEQLQAEQDRALISQQRMGIDPVTNQPYFIQPITIPNSITVGKGSGGSGGGTPVNKLPATDAGRKPLDAGTEKDLTQFGDLKSLQDNVIKNFKDDFVGFSIPGSGRLAFEAGRRGVDDYKPMAEWWQNYSDWTNQVRHSLYGSALTKNEQEAFEKSIVSYSDDKDVARANFEKQQKIVGGAIARRLKGVKDSGQNVQQAKDILGTELPGVEVKPYTGNSGGGTVKWDDLK